MTQIQTQDEILIPERRIVNRKGKEFECLKINGNYHALKELKEQGYSPVFMPQLVDARIEAPKDSRLWQVLYSTPSIIATGRIKNEPMVVFDHTTDNYFSKPENITSSIKEGLVNGAGVIPQPYFEAMVDKDEITDEQGNRLVWVLKGKKYEEFRKSSSGIILVKNALKHPQPIPFIGGEERAKRYLERYEEVCGNSIRIRHSDDLNKYGNEPLGRLLYVGLDDSDGLNGDGYLSGGARLVGVRDGAKGATQKISRPSLEQILKILEDHVPNASKPEVESRLRTLYK